MEVKPLGESPEVIHLFESMEQNRLYVEKSQMEEIVAHMDELLTSIKQIEKELADMRSLTGNVFTSIVDEGSTAVAEAKSVVQRAKYKIRDISGRAAALGGNALVSALHAAHIPNLLEKVQSVLHDTELRMRKSAHKAEAISEELHAANVHIANIERIMGGKDIPQNPPAERKGPLTVMRAGFLGLASTFDSSEQYAINIIGERALQSADYVVKESIRALEKAMGKRTMPPVFRANTSRQAYRPATGQQNVKRKKVHTSEYVPPPQSEEHTTAWVRPTAQYEEEKQEPSVHVESVLGSAPTPIHVEPAPSRHDEKPDENLPSGPAPSQEQGNHVAKRTANRPNNAKPVPAVKNVLHSDPESSPHMRATDNNLCLSEEHSLNTWQNSPVTNSLQNQGAALHAAESSGAAVQTFQAAIQAAEKSVTKIKETIENIAASAPRSSSSWRALAALFLLPLLVIAAIAGAFRGGGSAKNVRLSADVIALMPKISAACQANGIPEYAPLVAAVIVQESGGRVADVGGDVMQCAEGMGLPVGTPVSVEESINFGTGIIARNLREAGAAGPIDIPRISLALQGYNFGNGYISWALARGGYSKENAREFSEMQAAAHGWSGYGDIDYVDHVLRYYKVSVGGMGDASAIADGRFAYPLPGRLWDTYPGHNGIDISFANCYGEPVYAVAAGTVHYTQDGWTPAHGVDGMWSFGNSVFIEHGDGWISAYGHLSMLAVASGETVAQGQLIGYIGSTGNSTGPHLHLALYHNGDAGIGGQNFAELAWPQYRE